VIDDAGHMVQQQRPREFNAALRGFLAAVVDAWR
jgi:pimeloyl-ACP methyl ester carboxylesterase